jgi:hypothetical protein
VVLYDPVGVLELFLVLIHAEMLVCALSHEFLTNIVHLPSFLDGLWSFMPLFAILEGEELIDAVCLCKFDQFLPE